MAVGQVYGIAALIARAVALALSDLDRGLRGYRTDPVPTSSPPG
jgi:urea transporter